MSIELVDIVNDFAEGLKLADQRGQKAVNSRSGVAFQPGIGPHSEDETVRLTLEEMQSAKRDSYAHYELRVKYPENPRQRCDLCLGTSPKYDWCIEIKMIRFLGDNGKLNDNILMHVLSPYPEHRSALTDCTKLASSRLLGRKAVLIYGYDHAEWPLDPAVEAFEVLARARVQLGSRFTSAFEGLTGC